MNKDEVIKYLVRKTIEIKKKIFGLNKILSEINKQKFVDIEETDKETMVFLMCFSYYENFIKDFYEKIINFINYLDKNNINYPKEFEYLIYIYHKLGEKKTKLRAFNREGKYRDKLNLDKFYKENQQLRSIEFLLNFNTLISSKNKEEYILFKNFVINDLETIFNKSYKEKMEIYEELYKYRNDKMHGSYSMERDEKMSYAFDLFNMAIDAVSSSLIEAIELRF